MNYQVDIIIIGDSKAGHEILDKLAVDRPSLKIAFISQIFKKATTRDYLNVEYFRNKVLYIDYKNRLFGCYLDDGTQIYGTHVILATGLSYEPLVVNRRTIVPYTNTDELPKATKMQPAVVLCDKNADIKFVLDVAKKYKQVYVCVKQATINSITKANAEKLENTKNIVVLPNTSILKAIYKEDALVKVELNNYTTLNCSAIFAKTAATPVTDLVSDKLIAKDDCGYLLTDDKLESTLVPKCYAIGNCAAKYTNTMKTKLIETILADF